MLALLSSPVRRWVLTALLVPALALVLRKIAQFLQRHTAVTMNGGMVRGLGQRRIIMEDSLFQDRTCAENIAKISLRLEQCRVRGDGASIIGFG